MGSQAAISSTSNKQTESTNPVVIFTGAACKGNPGPGGWGVVLSRNGHTKELCGGTFFSTSGEMALTAAVEALERLTKPRPVRLHTDSAFIVEGMTQYLAGWKARGWRRADGKPVANAELWQRLDELAAVHQVEWVRAGHDKAKQLAVRGLKQPA